MFAQLDTKSVYSFMDSVVDLNSYVARAKELGYQALGLMDRDNCANMKASFLSFYYSIRY